MHRIETPTQASLFLRCLMYNFQSFTCTFLDSESKNDRRSIDDTSSKGGRKGKVCLPEAPPCGNRAKGIIDLFRLSSEVDNNDVGADVAMPQGGGDGAALGIAGVLGRVGGALVSYRLHGAGPRVAQGQQVVVFAHHARAGQAPAGGQLYA